jgi:hypothetical protein
VVLYYKMTEINEGDYIRMNGGAYKGWCGVVERMKPTFCVVEFKINKKGETLHTDRLKKCARKFMEVVPPEPIEMPTMENCVVVDDVEETLPANLIEELEKTLEDNTTNKENIMIDEDCVPRPALMMDEAYKYKEENEKLKLELAYYHSVNIGDLFRKLSLLEHEVEQLREAKKWQGVELEKLDGFKELLDKIKQEL